MIHGQNASTIGIRPNKESWKIPELLGIVFAPHFRFRALRAQYPDAEQTSFFLPSDGASILARRRVLAAKIAETEAQGWTYLRTNRSRGGGLTLRFIRLHPLDYGWHK